MPIVHMHKEQQKTVIKQHGETGELNRQVFPSDPGFMYLSALLTLTLLFFMCFNLKSNHIHFAQQVTRQQQIQGHHG